MARDLIHPRTRREFRELAVAWGVLGTIEDSFEVEGFFPGPAVSSKGERRSLFDTYGNVIDWTDTGQVGRAIKVFEEILSWRPTESDEWVDQAMAKVRRVLDQDGYFVDDEGRIRAAVTRPLTEMPLDQLADPAAIEEHLRRLDETGSADPPLAISSAKAILEATCKHVLEELGEPYDDKADIPALVKAVQRALKIHPESIAPTAKGRESIIRTLSNLSQVAIGLAELRNEYGPDHGRTRTTTGLGPRHAHLAIGASQTFCRFLLETLRDRRVAETSTT